MGSVTRQGKKVIAHGVNFFEVAPGEDFEGMSFDDLLARGEGELALGDG